MYLSLVEAIFESRLRSVLVQGSAPLRLGHHGPSVDVVLVHGSAQGRTDAPEEGRTAAPEEGPDSSIVRLQAVGRERSAADAAMIEAVVDVVEAVRERLLESKGLVGVELGRGQERSLDAEVRRAAVAEVEVLLGFGLTESQALVGVASAAGDLRAVILEALRRGDVTWPMVRVFWESSSRLGDSQRLLVATALFGQDRGLACEERLGPDGELITRPWGDGSYRKACEREVRACEGTDVAGERERRRRAYARRRASIRVHDDGTATLSVTGPAVTMAAVHQRVERVARLLRGAGDERSLDNLRCDTISTLLLYGTVQLPGGPGSGAAEEPAPAGAHGTAADPGHGPDEVISPEGLEEIARVVNAQPLTHVQVVVPHAVLGSALPVCASCAGTIAPGDEGAPPGSAAPPSAGSPPGPPPDADDLASPGAQSPSPPAAASAGRGMVAEVLGPHPFFITPGHARELALLPGTTLHRLVVDPLDGRLVERTIATYRPDADMRRQVIAADVYSRAPGTRTGSHACELDHVVPYGWAGGQTSEINLALLGKAPHRLKTLQVWRLAIGERRDLTFTTLLGQIVSTRSHDYRQYTHVRDREDLEDLDDRRDLANRAVYAAMAERPEQRYRRRADAWLSLTHTDEQGETRPGPPRRPATLDEVLGRDAEDGDRA